MVESLEILRQQRIEALRTPHTLSFVQYFLGLSGRCSHGVHGNHGAHEAHGAHGAALCAAPHGAHEKYGTKDSVCLKAL